MLFVSKRRYLQDITYLEDQLHLLIEEHRRMRSAFAEVKEHLGLTRHKETKEPPTTYWLN